MTAERSQERGTEAPERTEGRDLRAGRGMGLARIAAEAPERMAIRSPHGDRTFGELNARANQLARLLREHGVGSGDAMALLCSNRPEFAEVLYAGLRIGLRVTPINWHLQTDEVAYILTDCEAKAFIADARFADTAAAAASKVDGIAVRLALAGEIDGFGAYDRLLAAQPSHDIDDPEVGRTMLYTSGTTGRPKGVYRSAAATAAAGRQRASTTVGRHADYRPDEDTHLCTGPLYHAAPLAFSLIGPLTAGVGVVVMDHWDAEEALRLIERHRITHTHMVPTMFHRLIQLPEEVRRGYDTSSLRFVVHGAAPCPVHVKQAMMDWLGPVVYEYYAATEGGGASITPDEWLRKPGSVGRPREEQGIQIRGEDGGPVGPGVVGTVYLKAAEAARFEYYKDPDKTASVYDGDYFTLGDMGYIDEDGYLFLTGRSAEVIISGGVNIYPAEIDEVLLTHPAVADAGCVGVPNREWGEEVKAVVELRDGWEGTESLARELIEHCRANLAHYKCPRTVDFVTDLPRRDTGKILRRLVRDRYWEAAGRRI